MPSSRRPEQEFVIGHLAIEARLDALDLHHIDQEGHELISLVGKRPGSPDEIGIVGEKLGEVRADHARAGARGSHHIVEAAEGLDHLARDGARGQAIAGIIGRLPATGLARHLDAAAGLLEELDGGKADRGTNEVDEASDEEADARLSGRGNGRHVETLG